MARKKLSRDEETRDASTRDFRSRRMEHKRLAHALDIPPHIIPKNKTYFWGADMLSVTGGNRPNEGRIATMRMNGYSPVPRDRHPELMFSGIEEESDRTKSYIYRKGSILMEMDKREADEIKRDIYNITQETVSQTHGTDQFRGRPGMQTAVINENDDHEARSHRGFGY